MKHFKFKMTVAAMVAATISVGLLTTQPGCVTQKTTKVSSITNTVPVVSTNSAGVPSTNFVSVVTTATNTFVTVNQAVLSIDATILQGVAYGATVATLKYDPSAKPILVDIQTGMTGFLNGASTNSTQQLLELFTKSPNPTIVAQFTPVVNQASAIEQALVAKYGPTVAGQIVLALTKAALAGITQGL